MYGQDFTACPHIDRRIGRHRVAIHVFRVGHHHAVIGRLTQPIRVDFLNDSSGIGDHHSPAGRRGSGHILLIKCGCARAALPIERIGRHLIRLLSLVHDIRHKGVALLVKLLLLSRIGARFQ